MSQPEHWLELSSVDQEVARNRLKASREKSGLDPQDFTPILDGSVPAYYDLENCNGEITSGITLGQLAKICDMIGIKPQDLFYNEPLRPLPIQQLLSQMEDHRIREGLTIEEFEDRVGWKVGPAFDDATAILDWTVDALRWVCRELGLDWIQALPQPGEGGEGRKFS